MSDPAREVVFREGRKVQLRTARVNTLPAIIHFFSAAISRVDAVALGELITFVADAQKKAVADGIPLSAVDIPPEVILQKVRGNLSLIETLFTAVADLMPECASKFCELTPEEIGDLELDDGANLAFGIFLLNYHFFTRTLPPAIRGFLRSNQRMAQGQKAR